MGRLFCCGDTHGTLDISKLSTKKWQEQKELTRDDILVILGDSGVCWNRSKQDRYIQSWFSQKKFTTLSILGNHENYNIIETLPIVDFYGGKAYKVTDNFYYAINGEIYNINGKICFCMGGAPSHDKIYRKKDFSWWEQEIPTQKQREQAIKNLEKLDFKVDYIFTHCGPREVVRDKLGFEPYEYNSFMSFILHQTDFKDWYMGHYHIDRDFYFDEKLSKLHLMYNRIIEIK